MPEVVPKDTTLMYGYEINRPTGPVVVQGRCLASSYLCTGATGNYQY